MLKFFTGKKFFIRNLQAGIPPTKGYQCHESKTADYFLFDPSQVLPQYIVYYKLGELAKDPVPSPSNIYVFHEGKFIPMEQFKALDMEQKRIEEAKRIEAAKLQEEKDAEEKKQKDREQALEAEKRKKEKGIHHPENQITTKKHQHRLTWVTELPDQACDSCSSHGTNFYRCASCEYYYCLICWENENKPSSFF